MLGGICWCSASPMLPQGFLCWWSPVLFLSAGSPGVVGLCSSSSPSPRLMQLVWLRCLYSKSCFGTNAIQSWCGQQGAGLAFICSYMLLLWSCSYDFFGGSPGSDLTVMTTFISCSLAKWCKGKYFLHPLHTTYQGSCWIAFLVFGFWCMQPLQCYALFSTLRLQKGRCKNFSNVDLLCSNHKLTVCETCSVECLRLNLSSCLVYYETCINKV